MKIYFLFIAVMIVGFSSCNNEYQPTEESVLDNTSLKEAIKNQTIGFYNSRKSILRSSDFTLTATEKHELAQQSLNLLKSYGLTVAEINEDLQGITDDKLIDVAYSIIDIEEQASNGIDLIDTSDNFSLLTGEPGMRVQLRSAVYECALQAVGIAAIGELMSRGIHGMSKSAIKKLLKKIATKYLGWVGAAIAVYEFGDCMDWW